MVTPPRRKHGYAIVGIKNTKADSNPLSALMPDNGHVTKVPMNTIRTGLVFFAPPGQPVQIRTYPSITSSSIITAKPRTMPIVAEYGWFF